MRIGLDGSPLAEAKTGIGHYTYELARCLATHAPSDTFELISQVEISDSNIAEINHLRPNLSATYVKVNRLTGRWWTIGLPAYIYRNAIALYHGTNYEIPLWGGCPTVLTIHDLSTLLYSETHRDHHVSYMRRRLPLMARRATLIIAVSNYMRGEICHHLRVPQDKIVVVPEAPRSCFRPLAPDEAVEARKRLGIEDEFLLYVGTIEPRKNLLALVRAFEMVLRETRFRPQLVFAGKNGWLSDDLFAYIKASDLGNRLRFTGYVSDEDLRALYSSCRLLVYPSIYEGFGLPPLEAMACGAPVIASRIPPVSETVGQAARLIPPGDIGALARSIAELLSSSDARHHLAQAGAQRAAEFSWKRTARLTYDVYGEALKRWKS